MTTELSACLAEVPQSQPPQKPHPKSTQKAQPSDTDEAYRKIAAQHLGVALMHSEELLKRCSDMAEVANHNEFGAVNATARLMNATAQVAKALAQITQVEQRSRTIIETIQKPDPENAGFNSIFSSTRISSPEQRDKIRDVLERALLQFLEEQKQDRERQEGLAIGSCI